MSSRPFHGYHPPPPDEYFIHAQLRKKNNPPPPPPEGRDRLLQLAEKSRRGIFFPVNRSSYCVPESQPRMGLKARGKVPNRSSAVYSNEQSLPDKLTQALKSLRPAVLSHSASSSAPFRNSKHIVDADDVVYIPSSDKPAHSHRYSPNQKLQRKTRSIFLRNSPSQSDLSRLKDPPLKDLEQIRALYKSTPNVSSIDEERSPTRESRERLKRYSQRIEDDCLTELSSSTRSPTDSGYRSTSRHLAEDPYSLDDSDSNQGSLAPVDRPTSSGSSSAPQLHMPIIGSPFTRRINAPHSKWSNHCPTSPGVSHKTTTVVLVNGASPPAASPVSCGEEVRLRCNVTQVQESNAKNADMPLPFGARDIVSVLQSRRCRQFSHYLDASTLPRLVELLRVPLNLLTEEMRMLCTYALKFTVEEVVTAIKIVFPLDVFSSCLKAGMQATTLFALSGTGGLRKSISRRSELHFSVGKMYRWILDKIPNKPVSDTVAVFLTAALECALEELILRLVDTETDRVLTVRDLADRFAAHKDLCHFFTAHDSLSKTRCSSKISLSELIDSVQEIREQIVTESDGPANGKSVKKSSIKLSRNGIRALHYYVTSYKEAAVPVADWVRVAFAYAEYRMSLTVDDCDIQQAARVMLNTFAPPVSVQFWRHELPPEATVGEAKKSFAFQLISTANPDNITYAADSLEPDKLAARNAFGMCPLSEAIVQANVEAVSALLSSNCPVNCGVPSPNVDRRPYLLKEYSGWTPLTWAVAIQKYNLVQVLLNAKADVESEAMIKESPLQVAVQLGNVECARSLLDKGADPFKSSVVYDSLHAHFRNAGCPSALALAAARGNDSLLKTIMQRVSDQKSKSVSMSDFLNGGGRTKEVLDKSEFDNLAKETRLALQEAMYYAVETSRPEIAIDIKNSVQGLNWNIFIWTKALQSALELEDNHLIEAILGDFGAKLAAELTEDTIADCLHVLFGIVRWQCSTDDVSSSAASAISRLHHYLKENPEAAPRTSTQSPAHRPMIDHNYINNPQFSDIKFIVGDRPIYGHRIVLINASDKFKDLLQKNEEFIRINDVSYSVFLAMMEFIYTGHLGENGDYRSVLNLLPAAKQYGLPTLESEVLRMLVKKINNGNFAELFTFAIDHSIDDLIGRCERFMLDNFTLLVTEPSVRQLITQKRNNSYNVTSSLSKRLLSLFDASRKKH